LRVHVVQKGDTMWLIAKKYGISLESLIAANPQIPDPNRIDVGMKINIPGGVDTEPKSQMPIKKMEPPYIGPTCPPVKKEEHLHVKPTCPPVDKPEVGWPNHLKTITYIVKAGDTLFKIAQMFGISLEKIISANPQIEDPDKIDIGQKIFVPKEKEQGQYYCPMDEVKEHCPMQMPQEYHYYYQMPEEHHYHYMQPEEHNYFTMHCPTVECPTVECPTTQMPSMQMMMYYMPMPYYMPYYIPYYVPQYVPYKMPQYEMPQYDMPKSKCKSKSKCDHDWNLCHSSS
jgi:spore coat assembly protein SafA